MLSETDLDEASCHSQDTDQQPAKRRRANTQGDDAESPESKVARLEKLLDEACTFIVESGLYPSQCNSYLLLKYHTENVQRHQTPYDSISME